MDYKPRVQTIMDAMSQGRVAPLFHAMAEDVTWRWMGVGRWSRAFEGKQLVVDKLFGGTPRRFSVVQRRGSAHSRCRRLRGCGAPGRNELPDGRRYDNNCCWLIRFEEDSIQEVREYMDTQLVTETFGAEGDS